MSTKIVSHTLETLPQLTAAQKANLSRLSALPDSEIDTHSMPELSDAQWQSAVRGRFYKPTKTLITARLDRDVLEWLKSQGSGYQSRMNAILRRVMLEAQKQSMR